MERRRFPRIVTKLRMRYAVHLQDSEESATGQGILENISQGGMYFRCGPPRRLAAGDRGDFIINTTAVARYTSRVKALGQVVRIEAPQKNAADCGIAVQFLANLSIELLS
jgi:c-di-GMP-binding flagellar brake protein YcgR